MTSPFWLPSCEGSIGVDWSSVRYVCVCVRGWFCQAYRAAALHCAQQSNLRVIHFLQLMTLLSAAPTLPPVYTHFEVIRQISVSACALSPYSSPSSSFVLSLLPPSVSSGTVLYLQQSAVRPMRFQAKRLAGMWPAEPSLTPRYSVNETSSSAGVRLEWVCKKRWWRVKQRPLERSVFTRQWDKEMER